VAAAKLGQLVLSQFVREPTWNRPATALRSPELTLSSFKRHLTTHLSVPALGFTAWCPGPGRCLTVTINALFCCTASVLTDVTFCDVFFTFLTLNVIDDFAPDIFSILRYKNFFSRHLVGTE